jgi:hypothetical protein
MDMIENLLDLLSSIKGTFWNESCILSMAFKFTVFINQRSITSMIWWVDNEIGVCTGFWA